MQQNTSTSTNLTAVSYLSPTMRGFYEVVTAYLGEMADRDAVLSQHDDPLEDPAMLAERVDLAFICGLPLVLYNRISRNALVPLAAPVMQSSRYADRPIYFADIVVRADSTVQAFTDLAGTTLCYNDPGSNSGYNLLRYRMIEAGLTHGFFGSVIQSGSHQKSIWWVAEGKADCSVIDSTVLEQEIRNHPELADQLRIIESIGPCPMPPIVAARRLGSSIIKQWQAALLNPELALREAMDRARIRRFAPVELDAYRELGTMHDKAVQADYQIIR
ncbi:MAG: PhnD/SsuA/transferrin family substrate-binding protein [Chloroflexota bacterium]